MKGQLTKDQLATPDTGCIICRMLPMSILTGGQTRPHHFCPRALAIKQSNYAVRSRQQYTKIGVLPCELEAGRRCTKNLGSARCHHSLFSCLPSGFLPTSLLFVSTERVPEALNILYYSLWAGPPVHRPAGPQGVVSPVREEQTRPALFSSSPFFIS